jgi:hypothetical protein
MKRKRPKAVRKAFKDLKSHQKYRREFGKHIKRVLTPEHLSSGSEEIIERRKDAVRQLMDRKWAANSQDLHDALEATNYSTIGEVQVVGDHPKHNQKSRRIAFRYLRDYTGGEQEGVRMKHVMDILDHGKTDKHNAHIFLTALRKHGFSRTKRLMERRDINSRNILREIKKDEKKKRIGDTQRIELPKQ